MIVDGALAMSTFSSRTPITTAAEDNAAAQDGKALVSREALSKCISPKMVIHDYQLIGVNWMALMNTLECYDKRRGKMGRNRAKSNVNGVLADEMGLVSVVTILDLRTMIFFIVYSCS
jgi:SNF2 family DNA or RNA helicase